MVRSPLRTQIGSRASGKESPISYPFKGVKPAEWAKPIRSLPSVMQAWSRDRAEVMLE